jgi:hypothetical protein
VENAGKNLCIPHKLTKLKEPVTQVVLLKTGIFAVPIIFVEKQMKMPYNI